MPGKSENVKIVGQKLVLSLTEAKEPVVWQMNLDTVSSSGFIVKEDKKRKVFSLTLKQEQGEGEEIAIFSEKDDAVAVLMETAQVLQNIPANISPAGMHNSVSSEKSDKKGALIALCLVVVLILLWIISSATSSSLQDGQPLLASAPMESGATTEAVGVAVSADDFLNNR